MHQIQKILLKRLMMQNDQRYGTLTSGYDFEDNIVFHLNKLIQERYIYKANGIYSISLEGVKAIAKYEPIQLEDKGIKTLFIGFLCKDNSGNYLVKAHHNAKSNFYNLPSGKPYFGEGIENSLVRLFTINTGVGLKSDQFKFTSLHLKTIKSEDGEVIFDDAFTIYAVELDHDQKSQMKLINGLSWKSLDEISKLENRWPEIDICIINNDQSVYKVYTHISNYIL